MKRRSITAWLWLLVSAALAAGTAVLRRWQVDTAFEEELGLPIHGAPASVVLICVLAASGVLLILLAVRQRVIPPPAQGRRERRWDLYLLDRRDLIYPCILVASAFVMLAAAPSLFQEGKEVQAVYEAMLAVGEQRSDNGFLSMLAAFTAVPAFLGLLSVAHSGYRQAKRARAGFSAALPAVTGCILLIGDYRAHASDPVLWDYVPLLLAIVIGMLFYVDYAGMSTDAARPRRLLWLAGMTVILSAMALASGERQGNALVLISQGLSALAVLWRLPASVERPIAGQPCTDPLPDQTYERLEETTYE